MFLSHTTRIFVYSQFRPNFSSANGYTAAAAAVTVSATGGASLHMLLPASHADAEGEGALLLEEEEEEGGDWDADEMDDYSFLREIHEINMRQQQTLDQPSQRQQQQQQQSHFGWAHELAGGDLMTRLAEQEDHLGGSPFGQSMQPVQTLSFLEIRRPPPGK